MVFCPYCGQQFTRDEHLERHILTHTNVKPFRCLTCHMSFARRDLLQRHYTVHGRDQNQQEIPAANGLIPKSAGRTPIACVNCAKTKTRCDKKFPCSRCASRNLECTLRSTRRATKNAQRMELPPDGTVAAPPHNRTQPPSDIHSHGTTTVAPVQEPKSHSPEVTAALDTMVTSHPREELLQQSHDCAMHRTDITGQLKTQVQSQAITGISHLPADHYSNSLAFPETEEFASFGCTSDDGTSPHFMIDWTQLQLPTEFGTMGHPGILPTADISMDYQDYEFENGPDMMLPMMPDINGPLLTPIESPENVHCSKFDAGADHTRRSSSNATAPTPPSTDVESTVFATAQDSWSVFRCGPVQPSTNCPQTALLNLELLEQTLRDHEAWLSWRPRYLTSDTAGDHLTVMQLHESTRDKLLAITQSFLHKALEIHRNGSTHFTSQSGGLASPRSHSGSNFVLLPPARVLECFLRSYANCYERYFPISSRGTLDVNELMHCQNDRAASLLVLMMVSQGATNLPSREARMLTGGLIEACRISLFDLVERNIVMSGDPLVLQAALLFTVQAAWSGDKWQMDIAMGQRGMYLAMLRHSGLLGATATSVTSPPSQTVERLWSDWTQNERRSRLVYSWVMADQEFALMHDTAPLVGINELVLPMPDADRLWQAKNVVEWSATFEQVHEFAGHSSIGSGARPWSLQELFGRFLDDEMAPLGLQTTALQLRLLLQPLQMLVSQQKQFVDCLPNKSSTQKQEPSLFDTGTARSRLEGIRALLKRWHDLAQQYLEANALCTVMQTSLAIFHLINLNTVTNFEEIESLARRERFDGSYQQLQWRHARCIQDVEEAIFHCGQLIRHLRAMHQDLRPPWWAGAIYRAGLVLWTDSLMAKQGAMQNVSGMCPVPGPSLSIDTLPADHALILRYLTKREGVACVTKRDGSQMNIDNAFNVLRHCVQLIDEGNSTRFTDGIRSKLDGLSRR